MYYADYADYVSTKFSRRKVNFTTCNYFVIDDLQIILSTVAVFKFIVFRCAKFHIPTYKP